MMHIVVANIPPHAVDHVEDHDLPVQAGSVQPSVIPECYSDMCTEPNAIYCTVIKAVTDAGKVSPSAGWVSKSRCLTLKGMVDWLFDGTVILTRTTERMNRAVVATSAGWITVIPGRDNQGSYTLRLNPFNPKP